jgi:hypothetical protein
MRKLAIAAALAACSVSLLSSPDAQAQGYAPWPPPPGMSAAEYAARYGRAARSGGWDDRYQPGWRRERHGRPPAYDPYADGRAFRGRYGRSPPGHPAPPAGMTWQEYEAHRAGSGGG